VSDSKPVTNGHRKEYRHFGTSAELSVRHFGTAAEVSGHFGTSL